MFKVNTTCKCWVLSFVYKNNFGRSGGKMRPIMMGVVSSRSSSISLSEASSLTGLEEQLEAMALKERKGGEEEMSDERQCEIAKRQEVAENLLRKSSSHLLVTANSSVDHLHFIRCRSHAHALKHTRTLSQAKT